VRPVNQRLPERPLVRLGPDSFFGGAAQALVAVEQRDGQVGQGGAGEHGEAGAPAPEQEEIENDVTGGTHGLA
jgi:hypothetical protein